MRFDTVITGGGLSGLTAGIALAEAGQHVAIVTSGQSALHFSSGSFELLGNVNGSDITDPIAALDKLPASHPYSRIGRTAMLDLLPEVQPLLARAGVTTTGDYHVNRYRITPLGKVKPAWLTMDDFATSDTNDRMPWRRIAIVNIADFQDFYPQFLAAGLEKRGVRCTIHSTDIPALDTLRQSPTEMRATNIARVLDYDAIGVLAGRLNSVSRDADAIIMPAVVGLTDDLPVRLLRRLVARPVYFVSTMPTSVPGVRAQMLLNRYFLKLGGTHLLGDTVLSGDFSDDRLQRVYTRNHSPEPLEADNFIIATGSFFSRGLTATPDSIIEPTLGLDVDAPSDRSLWYHKDLYESQPFMHFGISTDDAFRPRRGGRQVTNLYGVGSVLGGCNPVKEGCGAGVAMLTALAVTRNITGGKTQKQSEQ